MSFIRVLGAEAYARHGVTDAERAIGGRYSFDLEIETNIAIAAATDHVVDTINYESAYRIAHDILIGSNRRLLESLVVEIARTLLNSFPTAQAATVRLRKLSAPIDGVLRAVEVEHSERR